MGKDLTGFAAPRLIFALDVPDVADAVTLAKSLVGRVGLFKIGLELFSAGGPDAVRAVRDTGGEIFLDLKLHDIPATVARASAQIASLGVKMFTVHAAGGAPMIEAAVKAAKDTQVIGVTVLTSLTANDQIDRDVGELAERASRAGAAGVVSSPQEVEWLRREQGPEFLLVTPGVRPAWFDRAGDDQARVATPADAILAGADYLVVGRPIRDSEDPPAAADRIVDEIKQALKERKRRGRVGG